MTEARRIIEALRCGVPNAHAVGTLGCRQPLVERRFDGLLSKPQLLPAGMLLKGGFGTGKSHTLEFLHQRALKGNFVCSKVTINKETPLHDPLRLFRAAAESAVVPGRCGNGIREAARTIDFAGKHYRELREWAQAAHSTVDSRLAASLLIFESPKADAETRDRMMQFWAGDPLGAAYLRECLRQLRPGSLREFHTLRQKDLALQRFQFISRLLMSAGYQGWVILVDEVELIGCYSILQRAKSYAELARFSGRSPTFTCPNLTIVFAITDDFDAAVLEGKADLVAVPSLLKERNRATDEDLGALAALGMKAIQNGAITLASPEVAEVRALYDAVKDLHGRAYSWSPPDVSWPEHLSTTRMRHYVKTWITEWDMRRMYPAEEIVVEQIDVRTDYSETGDGEPDPPDEHPPKSPIDELLERLL